MVKVRIPASTSNIGPGFDTLGLALNRYLYISASIEDGLRQSPAITVEGNGTDHIAGDESNLVYIGMAALAKSGGDAQAQRLRGVSIHIKNEIPAYGGLGGSGAAIAGGIFLANELFGAGLSRAAMLNIAVAVEGHPDNVSAALMGGLTVNCFENGAVHCRSIKITQPLSVVVCSPHFRVLTSEARKMLPKEIALRDAVVNIENVAALVAAFASGDIEALRYATGDRIHESHRATLIPGYEEVKRSALDAGALSFNISGAGPSVFSFATENESRIGEAMVRAFAKSGQESTCEIMAVENDGACVAKTKNATDYTDFTDF
jgi:homoserine kinase